MNFILDKIEIVNQKPAKQSFQKLVKESDLRDSLDEDDWKDFENNNPPENAKKEPNSDEYLDFLILILKYLFNFSFSS